MPSRITRNISAGIAVMALAAPAAQARPITEQSSGDAPPTAARESRASTTIVDQGFDWGSAAIGAGGAGAVILLSLAGGAHVAGIRTRLHRA